METRMFWRGSFMPVDIIALRKASYESGPKQATSPVDDISTPSEGSAPFRRWKENIGALTPTKPFSGQVRSIASSFSSPHMARVAVSMKFTPRHLDEKGKERDARRLHSITLTAPSLAMSCMLKGPVTSRALAILCVISSICLSASAAIVCGGRISVASPECTPAFSTCSEMVCSSTRPSCATASTSISRPSSMNLETTTGLSPEISPASVRKPVSSSCE
mmetsp:Transcript_32053/g.83929  ORF Transcript_32053/g.83929 Transcript_32053/m.83929 type:complete len:220 (-) Transcript_32053:313-972(-)